MARYLVTDAFWQNPFGLGTTADRSRQARLVTQHMSERALADWFEHDGVFQAVIARPIEDALRNGFEIQIGDAQNPGDTTTRQDVVNRWVKEANLIAILTQYFVQQRLFGGSVLLQVTNQNQSIARSDAAGPDPMSRFLVFAPSEIMAVGEYNHDPFSANFGLPNRWTIVTATTNGEPVKEFDVTWTRPIRSKRLYTTTFAASRNSGTSFWTGPTIAYQVQSQIEHWGISQQAAVAALQKLSQPVLATDIIRAAEMSSDADATVQQRLNDIDERASAQQTIVIDPNERLEILQSTVDGIDAVLDRVMVAVAAAAHIPVTVLFGVSPGGFGTGEGELKVYYDTVRALQREVILPAIEWILARTFPGAENWSVKFPPVDAPTQKEELEMREIQMRIDTGYMGQQALSNDEVANSRWGGEAYSFETTLDLEARQAAKEAMLLEPLLDNPDNPDPSNANEADGPRQPNVASEDDENESESDV